MWLAVSLAGTDLPTINLAAGLFVYGLGEGFVLPTLVNSVLSSIQSKEAGSDAGSIDGVFTTMQQISGAIGILFFGQLATHTTTKLANTQNYAHAFAISIWYNVALLLSR